MVSHGKAWPGAQELTARLHHPLPQTNTTTVKALAYTHLVGTPQPGDTILLNVTALARGLGTGGYALVIADTTTLPPDPPPAPGHLVKARYTPHQTLVLGTDEQESPHHHTLRTADNLHHLPVVTADLHSALPAIIAGTRHAAALAGHPTPRIAYVMTDGGALPAAFSRTIAALRDANWLHTCITVGQAFGGDHEAVTIHTGLLTAHHITHADIAIVTQGPGNLGTGTTWGFSGTAAGEALNATATLSGHPIAALRISGADPRHRHLGISHHSLTTYARVALAASDVVVPIPSPDVEDLPGWGAHLTARIGEQVATLTVPEGRHRRVDVAVGTDLVEALRATPVGLSTMGRGLDADPAAFAASAAAGVHAEALAHDRREENR